MKVTLLDYQHNALDILLYTKSTRLQSTETLESIGEWPHERKMEHLEYMRHTIQSSWEFCRYIFKIEGVTRAFTHQLVRTRTASYAQESQRTVDVGDAEVRNDCSGSNADLYEMMAAAALESYKALIILGEPVQNARGLLPTNITTSIIMGADLRTLSHMAELRLCFRTQGEYQEVFKMMRDEVIKVHPWAEDFIQVYCVKTGVCFFPNYKECPVQKYTVKTEGQIGDIKHAWENTQHVAIPVAKDGRTM